MIAGTALIRIWRLPATAAFAAVAFSYAGLVVAGALSGAARAEILIGAAVPAAGAKAGLGVLIVEAARREIAELNAAGGLRGETLRLQVAGDDCTAEGGALVAAAFVAAKAALVLGHPCSNAALSAARVYAWAGTTFIAIGARHPDLTAKRAGPAIFRIGGRDDRQALDTAAEFGPAAAGLRVAVIHDRTAYARGLADGVASGLKAAGAIVAVNAGIIAGEKDYPAIIAQLKTANTEAIYFAGFPAEAELILNGIRSAGIKARVIGCEALAGMNRTDLTVMIARQIGIDDITGLIAETAGASAAALGTTTSPTGQAVLEGGLRKHVWDRNGDDLKRSFVAR